MVKMRLIITVKSYPLPSNKYGELVCTAGIRDNGDFVRLYPIDFRGLPYESTYKKYQWVEVDAERHDPSKDPRKESFRPRPDTLKLLGQPLSTRDGWQKRKEVVRKHPVRSLESLGILQKQDDTSLGIVRVRHIENVYYEPDDEEWKPSWRAKLDQMNLFEDSRRRLEKIPYKFKFNFYCDDDTCKGHNMSITDWEVGMLYLRSLERCGSNPQEAAEQVCEKYRRICDLSANDVYFFVGTVLQWGSWIILGVFYPPKERETDLLPLPFD
jgi:hypothetical protein